jgi:excisionase family DNA binding protein
MQQQYLTEKQVSELTGLALSTLRNDRAQDRRIPYLKIGKSVRYDVADLKNFLESCKIRSTSDPGSDG